MNYTVEDIARVCHEANRALQYIQGDPAPSPPWEQAEPWQVEASVASTKAILDGATPEEVQEQWAAQKVADGWTYGPVKDAAAKTHPCLVPYDQLDKGQRDKDRVFVAIVQALT